MAMNEEALERVCKLSLALKRSAHLLLHHHHHLSLDTQTLMEVQDAFSLILEMEQHTHFHVLPPNHRQHPAIPHLQMTYDLLQKVPGLRLWPRRDKRHRHQHPQVNLRCFRSLHSIEVNGVPIKELRALQTLRSQLRRVVFTRSVGSLAELFVECGADQAGEFVWEHLLEATLSHNLLQEGRLDNSLKLLPNLRVLDISHCGLQDVSHLCHLSSLVYLDISHNHLSSLPHLPPTSSPSLRVLLASHNELKELKGLQVMTGLEEVNLAYNFLSSRPDLCTLAALPRLRSLTLAGNPLSCDLAYRRATITLLHPAVIAAEFCLDNHAFTQHEQMLIGRLSSPPDLPSPTPSLPHPLQVTPLPPRRDSTEQPPSLTNETLSRSGQGSRRRSRKKRTRHIALGGEEGDEEEDGADWEGATTPQPPHSLTSPTPPTPTPKIEPPPPPPPSLAFDTPLPPPPQDMFRHALASHVHTASPRSRQEQNDKLLEEILQSKTYSPTPPAPAPPIPAPTTTPPTTPTTTTSTTTTTNGASKDEEEEVVVVEEEEEEEKKEEEEEEEEEGFYEARKSEDWEEESDKEEEEEGACLILAQRRKDEEEEKGEEDVILSVTSTQFKEKHCVTAKTLFKWDIGCVENVEELNTTSTSSSSTTIKMTFDTTRPSHRSRIYTIETEDFARLQAALNPLQELSAACSRCLGQLSPSQGSKVCGTCSSSSSSRQPPLTPLGPPPLTSTPLHHLHRTPSHHEDTSNGNGGGGGGGTWTSPHPTQTPHQQPPTSSTAPHNPPQEGQGSAMQESSSSGSMTGSVCTAYERAGVGGPPSLPTTPHKTPHPSIQPPAAPQKDTTDGGSEFSASLYFSAEGSLGGSISPVPAPLPPSGSSGGDTFKQEEEEEEEARIGEGRGGRLISIAPWVESLLHTHTGYYWRWWEDLEAEEEEEKQGKEGGDNTEDTERKDMFQHVTKVQEHDQGPGRGSRGVSGVRDRCGSLTRPHNPVTYNYEDFSQVDHRLRLYLEVVVLLDPEEHLLGLVKAVMVIAGGRREFQGLLIFSSKKYYLLEIIGPEDDSPSNWLDEVHRGNLDAITQIYSLYQRQGVGLATSPASPTTPTTPTTPPTPALLLVCLADSHRANCFFNFLMETLGGHGVTPTLVEAAPTQEEEVMALLGGGEEAEEEEEEEEEEGGRGKPAPPTLFAIVTLLQGGGCSESQYLLINEKDLVLYVADLNWYLPTTTTTTATTTTTLTTTAAQKIHNVTAIEVHSPHHLSIHFLDELTQRETNWHLHVAAPLVSYQIIESVRLPWADLFSVDLQVTRHTQEIASG